MTGCCRGLLAQVCAARPNGCSDEPYKLTPEDGHSAEDAATVSAPDRHPLLVATQEDIDSFFKYVEKLPNGCWFWNGARSKGGGSHKKWYGSCYVPSMKKVVRAHRFSCEVLGKRPCPPMHERDHTCVFSLCVNPEHIEVITKAENTRRRDERRREREGNGVSSV